MVTSNGAPCGRKGKGGLESKSWSSGVYPRKRGARVGGEYGIPNTDPSVRGTLRTEVGSLSFSHHACPKAAPPVPSTSG